jgi:hypothetical protein
MQIADSMNSFARNLPDLQPSSHPRHFPKLLIINGMFRNNRRGMNRADWSVSGSETKRKHIMKQAEARLELCHRSISIPLRNWQVDEPVTIEIHGSTPKARKKIFRLPLIIIECFGAGACAANGFQIHTTQSI